MIALSFHVRQHCSAKPISVSFSRRNNNRYNRAIISSLLKAADPLPLRYLQPIALLLSQLAGTDETMLRDVHEAVQRRKRRDLWEKYKWVMVLAITATICWIMYLVGRPA